MNDKHRSRGIYLLPNLFTTAALFSGFFAILAAVDGHFEKAAIAIFVAMILDGLDGRIARMTHTQTDFGGEYDSLSDMIAFGLAPGLVMYLWALQPLGKLGWFAAFVYVAGAALRLARFNSQMDTADKRYFTGLPSPSAAAVVAGAVWVSVDYGFDPDLMSIPAGILTLLAGLAMISNLRYNSFKEIDFRRKVPFIVLVVIALVAAIIISEPPLVLFAIFMIYSLSGLVLSFRKAPDTDTSEPVHTETPEE
ncbi:MAG: CDP-diacylglycerol--serine O-phosphatidyltransferase [Chromatiales bacterium]|jgi:CDP-diacylglycerol--serine O-phosphatidyltransferase